MLADPAVTDGGAKGVHMIDWSSTTIKRVFRATVQCEAYAATNAVEHGDVLRATMADLHGQLVLGTGRLQP